MATLTPQAQTGLEYLKTVNPELAASISKSFASPTAAATPVDASVIGGGAPSVIVPPAQAPQVPDYSKVTVSTPQVVNTPAQDQLQTEQNTLVSDISATSDKLATKSARQSQLETDAGLPALNSQLNELNNQIRSVQSEALAATNKSEDRLAPSFAITGEQAAIERQRAVRVYGLSAAAEAIQGNISLANDHVTRALDAEFGGLEQEIDNKKFLLQVNMDSFDKEEKRRAEAQQIALDQQKDALAQQRMEKQNVYDVMKIATQYNAPTEVLNSILASKTYGDAIIAAGSYLQDPQAKYDLEGARLKNQLLTAQIRDQQVQTQVRQQDIQTAGAPIPSVSDTGAQATGEKASVLNAITGLKLSESQSNAVSYAFRMIEANSNINNSIGNGTTEAGTYNPTTLLSAAGRLVHSDNARTLDRDLENFIRAQLRKESGAQIADTEMEGGRKIYSPQGVLTNDKDIAATKATREQAIQSMVAQAGPAGAYLNQYFDYMQTGGITPDERSIIYGVGPNSMTGSSPAVVSGIKFY